MTVSTVNHSSCSKVQVYHASQASQPHQGGHYVSALHPARQKATHPICPNNVSLKKQRSCGQAVGKDMDDANDVEVGRVFGKNIKKFTEVS